MTSHAPNNQLAHAVGLARARPAMLRELAGLYHQADAELAGAGQPCRRCGRCCNFAHYGHRLYVTTAELALLMRSAPPNPSAAGDGRCPFQHHDECIARAHRTLGCRVFSCRGDRGTANDLYERCHARIRALHQSHRIPYIYAELTGAITALTSVAAPKPPGGEPRPRGAAGSRRLHPRRL